MAKKNHDKPFTDVELRTEFPQHNVAEHEVFLSFVNDNDAVLFHDWWNTQGAIVFNRYVNSRREQP